MSALVGAVDRLNASSHLFEAAVMALADIKDERQRKALDTLLYTAVTELRKGLEDIEAYRAGMKAAKA